MVWTDALAEILGEVHQGPDGRARKHMRDVKRQEIITDEKCENCGSPYGNEVWPLWSISRLHSTILSAETTRDLAKANDEVGEDTSPKLREEICDEPAANRCRMKRALWSVSGLYRLPRLQDYRKIQKGGKISAPDVVLEELCPQCSKHLVLKEGRFGPFTACSNYPTCKYIKQEIIGIACPECAGDLVVKRGSENHSTAALITRPASSLCGTSLYLQSCPDCGARFLGREGQEGRRALSRCAGMRSASIRSRFPETAGFRGQRGLIPGFDLRP